MTQTQHAARAATVMRDLVIIQTHVANAFDFTLEGLLSEGRGEPLVTIRQLAMYLCREITNATVTDIAIAFHKKNHGTITFAHATIPNKLLTDEKLSAKLPKIKRAIEAAMECRS